MAKAVDRKSDFSGELIRLYEEDVNRPSVEARDALAKVFDRAEAYIEFGITPEAPSEEFTVHERALVARYRAADPRWQLSLRLLAALATEDQIEAATDVNVIVARILGMKTKDLRYPSDEDVAAKLGAAPHVRKPLLAVDERNKSRAQDVRTSRKMKR